MELANNCVGYSDFAALRCHVRSITGCTNAYVDSLPLFVYTCEHYDLWIFTLLYSHACLLCLQAVNVSDEKYKIMKENERISKEK